MPQEISYSTVESFYCTGKDKLKQLRQIATNTILDFTYLILTLCFGIYMMVLNSNNTQIGSSDTELLASFGIKADSLPPMVGYFIIHIVLFQLFFTGIWGAYGYAKKSKSKKRLVDEAYENHNFVKETRRGSEVISRQEYVGQYGLVATIIGRMIIFTGMFFITFIPACIASPVLIFYRIGRIISRAVKLPKEIHNQKVECDRTKKLMDNFDAYQRGEYTETYL